MFELRDYQRDALASLWAYWQAGGGNPLIDLATGLGKSFLIAELGRRFCQRDRRVLVLSHIREIISQDFRALQTLWPDAAAGINCAALGERNTDAPIVLASVQSVFRNPQTLGRRDLILVDESHLIPHHNEGMYHATLAGLRSLRADLRVAGFTATPYRLSSGRLDQGEGRLFDRVVYRYGIREGIEARYLAPLVAKATEAEIDVADVHLRGGEFVGGELEAAADQADIVRAAAAEIVKRGRDRSAWLTFCCGIDHAWHVRDALRGLGVAAETITALTPAGERRTIIEAFRAGELRCLTGCNIFTTGFDVASIDLIAMLRPTWSPGLYVQMLGRGTRKADGKQNCLVVDFAGNVMRHGPVDAVTGEGGSDERERGEEPRANVCPGCESLVPPATKVCPDWPVRVPQHDIRASATAPLSAAITWLDVSRLWISEHEKPGRPPSLRVSFWTGQFTVSDWLAFEHGDGARWHAAKKWRALGG
jgi:DNA repair protein RadD